MFFRIALGFIAVLCMAFFLNGRADAAAEFCPVRLATFAPTSQSATYAYTVDAQSPRSVSAELVADTDAGWFSWHFPMTVLHPAKRTVTAGIYTVESNVLASPVMYVTFPRAVHVTHAFARQATTSGESVFGWDAEGGVSCEPPAPRDFATIAVQAAPAPVAAPVVAEPVDAPFGSTCAKPFADASVTQLARTTLSADYTAAPGNAVLVDVALDKSAAVLDAWLLGTSESVNYDQAALRIAKASAYSPAISYCRAVATVITLPVRFR